MQLCREDDFKLQNEVSARLHWHQRGQGVVVQNWHSFALEYFLGARRDDFVRRYAEELTVKRFEFKWCRL